MSDRQPPHPFDGSDDLPGWVVDDDLADEGTLYEEPPEDWDAVEVDDTPDDEPELVAEVAATTSGQPSVIVLSGPRAGTIVPGSAAPPTGPPTARAVATADAALAPGEVLMLVHQPGNYAQRIPHALARAHSDLSHTGLHLGISASLPRKNAAATASYLDSCAAASVRIADPEGYALPTDLVHDPVLSPTQIARGGYVAAAPAVGTPASPAWNRQVIQSQREAGANVLLTPGRTLDHNDPTLELEDAGRALDVLLQEVQRGEVPAWNLTLTAAWLIDTRLRDQLLAELVDRDDVLVWHVRVRWPIDTKPYGQALQHQLLQGYRELAETARQEERALLLPNTGLTGWVTLGWGSAGFGTGSSQTAQAWKQKQIMRAKKGVPRPAAVQRHHVSALLHTISLASHQNLIQTLPRARYPSCACPYCTQQAGAPSWRADVDAGHTIHVMAALAARVAAEPRRSRSALITQLVQGAEALHSGLPTASLNPRETPDHLASWSQMLP